RSTASHSQRATSQCGAACDAPASNVAASRATPCCADEERDADMTYDDRDRDMRKDPELGDDTLPENEEHGNEAVGAGAGAIGGALVGGAIAGPPGAVAGAVIGGAGGAAAGEATE